MASGPEDMGKENASTAVWKETASDKEAEKNPLRTASDEDEVAELVLPEKGSAAAMFGNCGVISVLFETPSGFAIFGYDAVKLTEVDAWKHIWADFVYELKSAVWLKAFQPFKDKGQAISKTNVSPELSKMIRKYVVKGQTLAVGNEDYKNVISDCLVIPCVYNDAVEELMWGLQFQMPHFLPAESSQLTNGNRFPMSKGMRFLLNYHNFDVNLNMMVTRDIIEMADVVYKCDRCVDKHNNSLRLAAKHLMEISRIHTDKWDLLKLATALKMICYPEDEISDAGRLFPELASTFIKDAPRYKYLISKSPCLGVYNEIYSARKTRLAAGKRLTRLVKQAKKAYEHEQAGKAASLVKQAKKAYEHEHAGKAASDQEVGPDRKKICRGFDPVTIDELTEWHTMLSAKRKETQVSPTLEPVDALVRYTQISSLPLNMKNRPGILSLDIHPSKPKVASLAEKRYELATQVQRHKPVGGADERATSEDRWHTGKHPLDVHASGVLVQVVHHPANAQLHEERLHGMAHVAVTRRSPPPAVTPDAITSINFPP